MRDIFKAMGVLLLILCRTSIAISLGGASLSGRVVEKNSHHPLPGAIVSLQGTRYGICANDDGYFELKLLPEGLYRIHVSVLGYISLDSAVALRDGDQKALLFELSETVYQINPVTVTATRERSLVSEVPASVEVLSARELTLRNIQDVSQAIENVSGVSTNVYGGLGDLKTASIRGSSSSQVLILVDGQRLNDAQTGSVDLSSIPVESIEQIEIVRGGTSALYGADAIGGVINILTKTKARETGLEGSANLLAGSWGTKGASLSADYTLENFFSILSYKFLKSDGDFTYHTLTGEEVHRQNGDMLSHGLFGKGTMDLGEGGMVKLLTLSGEYFLSTSGVAGTIDAPKTDARQKNEKESVNLAYEQKILSPYNTLSVQSYFNNLVYVYDDAASFVPQHSDNHNTAWGAEARGRIVLTDWDILTAGYAYRGDFLNGSSLQHSRSRGMHSLFGQMELAPLLEPGLLVRKVIAIPAVRWDQFSDFGGQVSPKLGVVISTGEVWQASVKVNYGRSFRAPAFNDLYWPRDAYSVGNADLKPEHGTDFDVGAMFRYPFFPGIALDLTYFRNSITDMILWLQGSSGIWSPENVGKADIQGIEMKAALSPWGDLLQLGWNYTYLDARNKTEDRTQYNMQLPYRARNVHNFSLRFGLVGLYALLDYSSMGKRYTTTANTDVLQPYHLFNAILGYKMRFDPLSLDAKMEVRNLENIEYQAMEGFPMPGREFRLSLEVRFAHSSPSQ
jgi:outer membrane cobalamin receptor